MLTGITETGHLVFDDAVDEYGNAVARAASGSSPGVLANGMLYFAISGAAEGVNLVPRLMAQKYAAIRRAA